MAAENYHLDIDPQNRNI